MLLQVKKGQTVKLTTAFADVGDLAVDPAEVRFDVIDPDGASTTYLYSLAEVTRDAAGSYSVTLTLTTAGKWQVTATGDDTNDAVDSDYIYVLDTP